jgi:hypothetical protein
VQKLGCDQPKTMKELLVITTRHASSEEAIRVIIIQGDEKMVLSGSRGEPPKAAGKGARKGT